MNSRRTSRLNRSMVALMLFEGKGVLMQKLRLSPSSWAVPGGRCFSEVLFIRRWIALLFGRWKYEFEDVWRRMFCMFAHVGREGFTLKPYWWKSMFLWEFTRRWDKISKSLSRCSSRASSFCFSRFFCLWAILLDFLDFLGHCLCFDCGCDFVVAHGCFESFPCSDFVVVLGCSESFLCLVCVLGAVGSELSALFFAVLSFSLISSEFLVSCSLISLKFLVSFLACWNQRCGLLISGIFWYRPKSFFAVVFSA